MSPDSAATPRRPSACDSPLELALAEAEPFADETASLEWMYYCATVETALRRVLVPGQPEPPQS